MSYLTSVAGELAAIAAQRYAALAARHAELVAAESTDPCEPLFGLVDHALPDLTSYRAALLAQPFESVAVGPAVFHGLTTAPMEPLATLVQRFGDCVPSKTFVRRSPAGQVEPNFIHTDLDMGDWTAILYLTEAPAEGDGTAFWRHRVTGQRVSSARGLDAQHAEWQAWRDVSQWERWAVVPAVANRLIWFESAAFHSRAIFDNYGDGPSARLIQVMFGTFREA